MSTRRQIDARAYLQSLVGREIRTLTGRPNRVLEVAGDFVIVATRKSPRGQPVPIEWVQDAMDRLVRDGEIEVNVPSVGYRSAFVGAVLAMIPGTSTLLNPTRVRLGQ